MEKKCAEGIYEMDHLEILCMFKLEPRIHLKNKPNWESEEFKLL